MYRKFAVKNRLPYRGSGRSGANTVFSFRGFFILPLQYRPTAVKRISVLQTLCGFCLPSLLHCGEFGKSAAEIHFLICLFRFFY